MNGISTFSNDQVFANELLIMVCVMKEYQGPGISNIPTETLAFGIVYTKAHLSDLKFPNRQ